MQHQPEKNPNGGYLTPNQYGLFGVVDVTPELIAVAQATGKLTVSVGELLTRQNGSETWQSARVALKPYTPREEQPVQTTQAAPAQAYAAPAPQPVHAQAPVAAQGGYVAAQPAQPAAHAQPVADPFADEIPF